MIALFQKIRKEGPILSKTYAAYLNKIKAKSIVQDISNVKVAKLVKIFSTYKEFSANDIYPHHLLKASRGSGFCMDLANVCVENVHKKIKEWTNRLQSKNLPVEFLIEEKLEDAVYGRTGTAVDYKFFCFHGKPAFFLCRDGKNRNFYDLEYKPIKLESEKELQHIDLTEMIRIASELSRPFPFVRIDLYNCRDGVYFGEYTFHCCEGQQEFSMDIEMMFGALW